MLPLEARKYLYDIREACELIMEFAEGKTLEDYTSDPMLRSAVERQFEIIGEALSQMTRLDTDLTASITDYRRIVSFRNRLIHGYANISDNIVWGILESNLPRLREEVAALLAEEDKS